MPKRCELCLEEVDLPVAKFCYNPECDGLEKWFWQYFCADCYPPPPTKKRRRASHKPAAAATEASPA